MAMPLSESELWEKVRAVWRKGRIFYSLVQGRRYTMIFLDEDRRHCVFEYESNRQKSIPLTDLYAVYRELYKQGCLPRAYFRDPENCLRVLGRRSWHAPGAAIYALLPLLDESIKVKEGGHLRVRGWKKGDGSIFLP